jgi:hypothetical protein
MLWGIALFGVVSMAGLAVAMWLDYRRIKRDVKRLLENPELIKSIDREGPDGDGYTRLYVHTNEGKKLHVAYDSGVDAVEQRLKLAVARRDGKPDSVI